MTDTTASQNKNDNNASATSSNLSNTPTVDSNHSIWPYDLYAEQPVGFWQQELKFDAKALFLNLGKAAISGVTAKYDNAAKHTLDALASFSAKEKASVAVWALIFNAMSSALNELMEDYQDLFALPADMLPTEAEQQALSTAELEEKHKLAKQMQEKRTLDAGQLLAQAFANANIAIPHDFFSRPETLPLFAHIESPLIDWLQTMGMRQAEATAFYNRLRQTCVLHLHKTWLSDYEHYTCIEHAVDSPFSAGVKTERAWHAYHAWLQAQTEQRMFAEAFSLRDVYVPLNAWYDVTEITDLPNDSISRAELNPQGESESEQSKKQVVSLHNEMTNWVQNFNKNMAVRVISGGPGAGKSSFAKLFAADICKQQPDLKVLFIPLHHFNIDTDLTSAVNRFVADDYYLSGNPLDAQTGENRLLIIFDGLDELSMQGKSASDAANDFVEEVLTRFNRFNDQGMQRQAIITGRDVAISSASSKLREPGQILQVLPYFFDEPEYERKQYLDPNELLKQDLRQTWWQNFAKAKQLNYTGLPEALNAKQLVPITREPLLNYLVALSFERNQVEFNENTSLNEIYADLLKAVYERQYENKRIHQSAATLKFTQFERVLEEIALAVWHNGGNQSDEQAATGNNRVATLGQIDKRLTDSNIKEQLQEFTQGAEKGVTRLLTAFYFRESQHSRHSDKSFEFTHKSFGEYLIAKRIVRAVLLIDKKRRENDADSDDGWSKTDALKYWAEICSVSEMDEYIALFVEKEIQLQKVAACRNWQNTIDELVIHTAKQGLPMEKLSLPTFRIMTTQSKYAETSLLFMRLLMAMRTGMQSDFSENIDPIVFTTWANQYSLFQYDSVVLSSLHEFSFCKIHNFRSSIIYFSYQDIIGSDLSFSEYHSLSMIETHFLNVELIRTDFFESTFKHCFFENCNLTRASFIGSIFLNINFKNCNLDGTNFRYAKNLENVTGLETCTNLDKAIFPEGFEVPKPETIEVNDDEQQENMAGE